jgi:transcriptional regulator with XRE-family HTH domain
MPAHKNVCGKMIQKLRIERGLDQDQLAGRLTGEGWTTSENVISKIESGFRRISDEEILIFARLFRIHPGELFPSDWNRQKKSK